MESALSGSWTRQTGRAPPAVRPHQATKFLHTSTVNSARLSTVAAAKRKSSAAAPLEPAALDGASQRKAELLEAVIASVNSRYGKGSLMKLGSMPQGGADFGFEFISTGCMTLDAALGGGLPKGRIIEVFGPESSGKTTLALHAIAEVQRTGGNACLIDAENAFHTQYAKSVGVDVENLVVNQPNSGEEALEIMDTLARSNAFDLVVVDSVAALTPRAEVEGEIGMTQVGSQARLMSGALKKLCSSAAKSKCTLMFLNQIRNKIGVMYGSPEVTSGGNALKFYASVRVDIRRKEQIQGADGRVAGVKTRAKVVKNKVAPPFREAMFDIMFGSGIDAVGCVIDAAEATEVVSRRGAFYYYGEAKLGQGRDKAVAALREDPELRKRIEESARARLSNMRFASSDDEGSDVDDDGGDFSGVADASEPAAE